MDGNLFAKYTKTLEKKRSEKEDIVRYIYEVTGVLCTIEELVIDQKKVTICTSSVKKMILQKYNIQNVLQEKGYHYR
ncbi:MAG: hypothetical protein RLZZ308_360 [Candidatus Parcubacteria bacterium]|jgi:hypothetical protein